MRKEIQMRQDDRYLVKIGDQMFHLTLLKIYNHGPGRVRQVTATPVIEIDTWADGAPVEITYHKFCQYRKCRKALEVVQSANRNYCNKTCCKKEWKARYIDKHGIDYCTHMDRIKNKRDERPGGKVYYKQCEVCSMEFAAYGEKLRKEKRFCGYVCQTKARRIRQKQQKEKAGPT